MSDKLKVNCAHHLLLKILHLSTLFTLHTEY